MQKAINTLLSSAVYVLLTFLIITSFMLAISTSATDGIFPDVIKSDLGDNSGLASLEKPVLKVKSSVLTVNDHFIPINYIETATYQGQDIKDRVLFYGEVNTETAGEYHVVYYVSINGVMARQEATFLVEEDIDN